MGQLRAAATVFTPSLPGPVSAATSQQRSSAPALHLSEGADRGVCAAGPDAAAPRPGETLPSISHLLRLSDIDERSGGPAADVSISSPHCEGDAMACAAAREDARRSLAQTLRILSDDEDYAAGGGCWDRSSSDCSSDDGLLALAGLSTEARVSGTASSSTPPKRCGPCAFPFHNPCTSVRACAAVSAGVVAVAA